MDASALDTLVKVVGGGVVGLMGATVNATLKSRAERRRMTRSVVREIFLVHQQIETNIKLLEQDNVAAKANNEVVQPPGPLMLAAVTAAAMSGTFAGQDIDIDLYFSMGAVNIVNDQIERREHYRFSNAAMCNFSARRSMINDLLLEGFEKVRAGHRQLAIKLLAQPLTLGLKDRDFEGLAPELLEQRFARYPSRRLRRLLRLDKSSGNAGSAG
ncbi:MAG TPA: hypothetical protein VGN74_03545 [Brevundimonas sp.]|jgi:hypothetical protein|uniref:hypothetical protein n=1 Tax=Brevundimonas sp. TaxID=1871086 RepID=UPI002E12DF26|nr:hypothetical protein [Brevundimonas sp.]